MNKITIIVILSLAVLAIVPIPVYSQADQQVLNEAEWREFNMKIVVLFQQGKQAEATQLAEEALEIAKKSFGPEHVNVAKTMNNLGNFYFIQGNSQRAEELYLESIVIEEKTLGKEDVMVADSLYNLSMIYIEREDKEKAKAALSQALQIKEKKLGKNHPELDRFQVILDQLNAT